MHNAIQFLRNWLLYYTTRYHQKIPFQHFVRSYVWGTRHPYQIRIARIVCWFWYSIEKLCVYEVLELCTTTWALGPIQSLQQPSDLLRGSLGRLCRISVWNSCLEEKGEEKKSVSKINYYFCPIACNRN